MLDYLKESTAQIHRDLEQISLAKLIVNHSISSEDYQKFLIQNLNFYTTIEQALLSKISDTHPYLQPFLDKGKSQNLKKDLTALGLHVNGKSYQNYNYHLKTENDAIGALYVSEGSMLGGLVIGKHLLACPSLQEIEKHYFFGENVQTLLARWKKFREVVEQNFNDPSSKAEVLKSATNTFELFGSIMRE